MKNITQKEREREKKSFQFKTILHVEEGGKVEMEIIQIKGVDDTERETEVYLQKEANLVITERMMTEGKQKAKSDIQIELKVKIQQHR